MDGHAWKGLTQLQAPKSTVPGDPTTILLQLEHCHFFMKDCFLWYHNYRLNLAVCLFVCFIRARNTHMVTKMPPETARYVLLATGKLILSTKNT